MPPRPRPPCTICHDRTSKYACASCRADYCSVACYKTHQETCAPGTRCSAANVLGIEGTSDFLSRTHTPAPAPAPAPAAPSTSDPITPPTNQPLQDPPRLRPLTALKWPYVPDTSAYPDPLSRDDPKPLQTHQYEAIATSPAVRALLDNPRLCTLLAEIDALRGMEREAALQRALGVDGRLLKNADGPGAALDEDTRAFRAFAEAVEAAVRGGREDALGLDWD